MTNQPHFDVFLAHNSQDKSQVRAIATELKRRNLNVWLDEDQIPPGRPFQDVIQQAIHNVKSAAIFIGPGGLGKWQILELRSLLSQFVDADIPIVPVLLPGVDRIPRDLSFLQDLNLVSFANRLDDENALERLVWGITQQRPIVLPQPSGHFDVLLFYNDEDDQEVQPIINQLRERHIRLWLAQEVRGGDSWQQVLETQLAQINSVAVFIGRSGSLWRREQIELFIWEFIEQGRPVIPVILPNVLQEPELPLYLRRRTRVDFRQQDPNPTEQLIRGITENSPTPPPPTSDDTPPPPPPTSDDTPPPLNFWLLPIVGIFCFIVGAFSNPAIRKYFFHPEELQFSLGEKILFKENTNPNKEAGVQEYIKGNFDEALSKFDSSLKNQPNDPEALIYKNNAAAAQKKNIKIAVSVPIGNNPEVAQEILRGVALAQNEVNQNDNDKDKINGALLQVEIANDNNNKELAEKIAYKLSTTDSILAVVGHNSSEASIAAARVYQEKDLVMITPTSDAITLSENYRSPILHTMPSMGATAAELFKYAITADINNIAICFDSEAKASITLKETYQNHIKTETGGKLVSIDCDFSKNFKPSTSFSNALKNGANAILLLPSVDRIEKAIDIAQVNRGRLILLGSPTMNSYKALKGGCNINGMVVGVPWNPTAGEGKLFADRAKELWGGSVNWRTAMAYDATQAIITGLRKGKNTREGLKKVLSDDKFSVDGATGKIRFPVKGNRETPVSLLKVQPSNDTDTGYDFASDIRQRQVMEQKCTLSPK